MFIRGLVNKFSDYLTLVRGSFGQMRRRNLPASSVIDQRHGRQTISFLLAAQRIASARHVISCDCRAAVLTNSQIVEGD